MVDAFEELPKTLTSFACVCKIEQDCFECYYKSVSYHYIISYNEAFQNWKEEKSKTRIISRTRLLYHDLVSAKCKLPAFDNDSSFNI